MYSILFLGNSFTHTHDVPEMLRRMAASREIDVRIDSVTKGGCDLSVFHGTGECAAQVRKKLKERMWDYVVLQEHSLRPCVAPTDFMASVQELVAMIHENGAAPVLYSTWAYQKDCALMNETGMTPDEMTDRLHRAYLLAAMESRGLLAPVGQAFAKINREHPEIHLYDPDGKHPNLTGSVLAANVLFSALFGLSPVVCWAPEELTGRQAYILEDTAYDAVTNFGNVPLCFALRARKEKITFLPGRHNPKLNSFRFGGEEHLLDLNRLPVPEGYIKDGKTVPFSFRLSGAQEEHGVSMAFTDAATGVEYRFRAEVESTMISPLFCTASLHNGGKKKLRIQPGDIFAAVAKDVSADAIHADIKTDGNIVMRREPLKAGKMVISDARGGEEYPILYLQTKTGGAYLALTTPEGRVCAQAVAGGTRLSADLGENAMVDLPAGADLALPCVGLGFYTGELEEGVKGFRRWFDDRKARDDKARAARETEEMNEADDTDEATLN